MREKIQSCWFLTAKYRNLVQAHIPQFPSVLTRWSATLTGTTRISTTLSHHHFKIRPLDHLPPMLPAMLSVLLQAMWPKYCKIQSKPKGGISLCFLQLQFLQYEYVRAM